METKTDSRTPGASWRRGPTMWNGASSEEPALVHLVWWAVYLFLVGLLVFVVFPQLAHGGGPRYVAGSSYFDPATKGAPLTWAQGTITYYTDQGDLSPLLPQTAANAFVADALSRWTVISTAAVAATPAGTLAEDVNGTNVLLNGDGTITMPPDILPTATNKPLAIVYDADGAVTDALLGLGAGGADYCFTNAVFGGPDNLSSDAHIVHALIIVNGNCAQTSAELPDVKYRLVRTLGRTLGLDWSQANLNVITRQPPPTPDDYTGFPVMHASDLITCVPISACYPDADLPKMDDRAALSRLYPVTQQNQGNFPGKQVLSDNTARIHGTVYFVDASGLAGQGMQGVNAVARWIDPTTGQPSRSSVATSISGFLFCGNAGNPVTGSYDGSGQELNRFGSDDATWEGFFDLAGLEIPSGASSTNYQLSVESLDPVWSQAVGPYAPWQVQPSGAAQPITLTVSKGGDLQQDILMQVSAIQAQNQFGSEQYSSPAPLPPVSAWIASLGEYGSAVYNHIYAQADRTLSIESLALDQSGSPSQSKALPVIGIWGMNDPPGTPPSAATPMAFNQLVFGLTRLDADVLASGDFRIGVADYRGDGRPDYRYQMRVLYGDTLTPARAKVGGGTPLVVQGVGFRPGMVAGLGTTSVPPLPLPVPVLGIASSELVATAPAMADGVQSLTLLDPSTGSFSTMSNVLTYGAGKDDTIALIAGGNPSTPVGAVAPNPIRVGAYAPDGVTPVGGASVYFEVAPAAALSACANASSCTVLTDESGQVSTTVTVLTAGTMTITAKLAPATYNPPKSVQTTLLGTSSALDLALTPTYTWIAQGTTTDVALTARVLSNGTPQAGKTVTYQVVQGSGTLTYSTTTTNSSGDSNNTLHISNISSDVWVSACVQPGSQPCQTFYVTAVALSALRQQPVSGSAQAIAAGQNFQLITVRVTDSSTPPNPVLGASVVFQQAVSRPQGEPPVVWIGDTIITRNPGAVIVSSTQTTVQSGVNGLATFTPSVGGLVGPAVVNVSITAGSSTLQFVLEALAGMSDASQHEAVDARTVCRGAERCRE